MSKIIYTLTPLEVLDSTLLRRANSIRNKIRIEMKRGRFSLVGIEQAWGTKERYVYEN